MSKGFRVSVWLAAALILSQWLLVVHAADHPLLQPDVECQVCVAGHASAGPAPDASAPLELTPATTTGPAHAVRCPAAPRRTSPAIRAPPLPV